MGKKINIIGAGPGGLTAGLLLQHKGYDVTIFEKDSQIGGRNTHMDLGPYRFDVGPTFLMMKFVLDEIFQEIGEKSEKHLRFTKLDPMYQLTFSDLNVNIYSDHKKMKEEIAQKFNDEGYDTFIQKEQNRYMYMYPCLQKEYTEFKHFFRPEFIKALPHLSLTKTMYQTLATYFKDERLRIAFTFQSKYLGMSPWTCPAAFMIIPYVEHAFGIYHVEGGLSEISQVMANLFLKKGGKLNLNTPVSQLELDSKKVIGVTLKDGSKVYADATVINADFAHAMTTLVPSGTLKKYSKKKLDKKGYSCSTYMIYLGVDRIYNQPHHKIIFSKNYKDSINAIAKDRMPSDFSVYVRNASVTDPTVAPKNHSALYILVPVPNTRCDYDWKNQEQQIYDAVIQTLENNGYPELTKHIVTKKTLTPLDWAFMGVYKGATFNLAHSIDQMLYFRPRNRFEELESCYLVGGGTHPGSGLPTIYESGRISARLLDDDLKQA